MATAQHPPVSSTGRPPVTYESIELTPDSPQSGSKSTTCTTGTSATGTSSASNGPSNADATLKAAKTESRSTGTGTWQEASTAVRGQAATAPSGCGSPATSTPAVRDVLNDNLKERLSDRLAANNIRNSVTAEALLRKALFYETVAAASPQHIGGLIEFIDGKYAKGDLMDDWVAYAQPIVSTLEATGEWDNKNIWPGNRGAIISSGGFWCGAPDATPPPSMSSTIGYPTGYKTRRRGTCSSS